MQFQIDSVTADNLKAMMNITTADLQTMTFKIKLNTEKLPLYNHAN